MKESPFWTNLFDSFMKSIDWRSNRMVFKFYLGFDKADELYDTGTYISTFDVMTHMRKEGAPCSERGCISLSLR